MSSIYSLSGMKTLQDYEYEYVQSMKIQKQINDYNDRIVMKQIEEEQRLKHDPFYQAAIMCWEEEMRVRWKKHRKRKDKNIEKHYPKRNWKDLWYH